MHEKQIRTITALVADALAEQKLPFAKDRKAALELLRTPGWAEELSQLLPIRRRLECGEGLDLCTPILPKLSPVPEEGWLAFCYRYVRSILYPEGNFAPDAAEYEDGARFYLTVLQVLLDQERAVMPFDPLVDFQFLTPQEYESCDCGREYERFLRHFRTEYVYELMRLGQEVTPFRTLGHIAGVHYIAMTAARGLQAAGVDIDLALISGAAAAHDSGKYGCRPGASSMLTSAPSRTGTRRDRRSPSSTPWTSPSRSSCPSWTTWTAASAAGTSSSTASSTTLRTTCAPWGWMWT